MTPMRRACVGLIVSLTFPLFGCSPSQSPSNAAAPLSSRVEAMRASVAAVGGYSPAAIEILASASHVRVILNDVKLAQADSATRQAAADAIAAAIEQSLQSTAQLAALQAISVAIMHPAANPADADDTHTEEVVSYFRAPNGRFSRHRT